MNEEVILSRKNIALSDLKKIIDENLQLFEEQKYILLKGELGAGKTQLVKIYGELIGEEEIITSPTFQIIKEYEKLIHIDAYRIKDEDLGITDYNNVIFIEWFENVILPVGEEALLIEMEYESQNRNITIKRVRIGSN